jgi:hypothetical protein
VATARFQPQAPTSRRPDRTGGPGFNRISARSQCAAYLSAEARHKIFDNNFFLKYIQQLGLRKISHFHNSHAWALAPHKTGKWQAFFMALGVYFFTKL